MDHRHFSVLSHILPYIVNLALRALIIYPFAFVKLKLLALHTNFHGLSF